MTDTVNIYDAKTNLSKLVDRAAAGEEIVIAKAGKPKAKLVPYQPAGKSAGLGRTCSALPSPIAKTGRTPVVQVWIQRRQTGSPRPRQSPHSRQIAAQHHRCQTDRRWPDR